jgi:hypothetical protein
MVGNVDLCFLCADLRMSESQKRSVLQDLDLHIRMGSHVNLVHLIGICEEPGEWSLF